MAVVEVGVGGAVRHTAHPGWYRRTPRSGVRRSQLGCAVNFALVRRSGVRPTGRAPLGIACRTRHERKGSRPRGCQFCHWWPNVVNRKLTAVPLTIVAFAVVLAVASLLWDGHRSGRHPIRLVQFRSAATAGGLGRHRPRADPDRRPGRPARLNRIPDRPTNRPPTLRAPGAGCRSATAPPPGQCAPACSRGGGSRRSLRRRRLRCRNRCTWSSTSASRISGMPITPSTFSGGRLSCVQALVARPARSPPPARRPASRSARTGCPRPR